MCDLKRPWLTLFARLFRRVGLSSLSSSAFFFSSDVAISNSSSSVLPLIVLHLLWFVTDYISAGLGSGNASSVVDNLSCCLRTEVYVAGGSIAIFEGGASCL